MDWEESTLKIILIGSRGNLGEQLLKSLLQNGNQVVPTSQSKELDEGFIPISPWRPFQRQHLDEIDFIINAANFYRPSPNALELKDMEDSILGISETISTSLPLTKAKIITFSTYFQYAPEKMKPWSEYSSLKSRAVHALESACVKHGNSLTNMVLRDNFGGSRRDKFLDLAISANKTQHILPASPGESILNLVHVEDITDAITRYISSEIPENQFQSGTFEISSKKSYTLKGLIDYIDSLSNKHTNMEWGSLPYREREVFEEWKCADSFPYFRETRILGDYIKNRLEEE